MEWQHLNLRQLQVLKAVAEAGSMAQAARELFMTGPAVTQQIKQLEKVLGAPAFDRVGRKLKITAAGERTLAAANDVQGRLGLLAKEMDEEEIPEINAALVFTTDGVEIEADEGRHIDFATSMLLLSA